MGGNSMKNVIRSLVSLAVLLALAMAASTSAFAAEASTNWEDGYITVEGYGVAPANARTAGQVRAMARRAAQLDAYRNIAEAVQGVSVDGETTVEEAMVTSDVIRTKVSALVKGARIVSEHAESDGSYVVTMRAPLYGIGSVADAVFSEPHQKVDFPAPTPTAGTVIPEVQSVPATSTQPAPVGQAVGNYTGLIVDCRGLGLKAVMSPRVKNQYGEVVYGIMNVDPDWVIAHGMAAYTTDRSRAARAGSNPLVVKAISVEGFQANPVLSVDDANRILVENAATGFLNKTNVVFLR